MFLNLIILPTAAISNLCGSVLWGPGFSSLPVPYYSLGGGSKPGCPALLPHPLNPLPASLFIPPLHQK